MANDNAKLRRIVRQQLMALRLMGIHEWRKPTGKYHFEVSNSLAPPTPESRKVLATPHPNPNTASEVQSVKESTSRFQQANLPASPVASSEESASRPVPVGAPSQAVTEQYPQALDVTERQIRLQELQNSVAACSKCPTLCEYRTQTVFGAGNIKPRLVFLGEAPGEDEDRQGVPFVGRAGQLLTKIIKAMNLSRDDVYILNTVKCRPPMNRNPAEDELANCWEYLVQQLDILQPEVICCLGSIAMRKLLQTTQSIGRMRGNFYRYKESKVLVTYHPSYLLRMENQTVRGISPKRMVWDDMKLILSELGLPLP